MYKLSPIRPRIEVSLYIIGDLLLFYKIVLGARDRSVAICALLDYSILYIFISISIIKRLLGIGLSR